MADDNLPKPIRRPMEDLPKPIRRKRDVVIKYKREGKPDSLMRIATVIAIGAWTVAVLALAFADTARPNYRRIGLDRFFGVSRRDYWDGDVLQIAFWMMVAAFVLSGAALVVRSRRMRRDSDRIPWGTVVLMTLSGVAAVSYLAVFR